MHVSNYLQYIWEILSESRPLSAADGRTVEQESKHKTKPAVIRTQGKTIHPKKKLPLMEYLIQKQKAGIMSDSM